MLSSRIPIRFCGRQNCQLIFREWGEWRKVEPTARRNSKRGRGERGMRPVKRRNERRRLMAPPHGAGVELADGFAVGVQAEGDFLEGEMVLIAQAGDEGFAREPGRGRSIGPRRHNRTDSCGPANAARVDGARRWAKAAGPTWTERARRLAVLVHPFQRLATEVGAKIAGVQNAGGHQRVGFSPERKPRPAREAHYQMAKQHRRIEGRSQGQIIAGFGPPGFFQHGLRFHAGSIPREVRQIPSEVWTIGTRDG